MRIPTNFTELVLYTCYFIFSSSILRYLIKLSEFILFIYSHNKKNPDSKLPYDAKTIILYTKNFIVFEFGKWKIVDFFSPKLLHLYGIHGFFGQYGQGKTMSMVYTLLTLREKYGSQIHIATNFHYYDEDSSLVPIKDEDGNITKHSWQILLEKAQEYRQLFASTGERVPLVIAYDEIQNEFTSRDYEKFPVDLMRLLTQNRKGAGVQILYTAQHFDRVDKIIRELTMFMYDCNTWFGRLSRFKMYQDIDYIAKNQAKNNGTLSMKKFKTKSTWFVQTDAMRNSYDSFQFLDTAFEKGQSTMADKRAEKLLEVPEPIPTPQKAPEPVSTSLWSQIKARKVTA